MCSGGSKHCQDQNIQGATYAGSDALYSVLFDPRNIQHFIINMDIVQRLLWKNKEFPRVTLQRFFVHWIDENLSLSKLLIL